MIIGSGEIGALHSLHKLVLCKYKEFEDFLMQKNKSHYKHQEMDPEKKNADIMNPNETINSHLLTPDNM